MNPIAGMGGRVGLKGTDGEGMAEHARSLGARPSAGEHAAATLDAFLSEWPTDRPRPELLTAGGEMGETITVGLGYPSSVVTTPTSPTSADDTMRAARTLKDMQVHLLLFAGGDGTARDVFRAVDQELPVLGIPAGVKIQSAVFARSPRSAGSMAATFLLSSARVTDEREVVDLDEDAYRAGRVAPRLHGLMQVPRGPRLQHRKAPTPPIEQVAMQGIAAAVVDRFEAGHRYILGPGTTTRAIAEQLGVPKTLVGVDVVAWEGGIGRIVAADATEADLLRLASEGLASIVLTPIGGQGFILGRGNQQVSPAVVRAIGLDAMVIVATPAKLAAFGGRSLLVDTGDAMLDAELSGYVRVITGRHDEAVVHVEPA